MCIITVRNKKYMACVYYLKQSKSVPEIIFSIKLDEKSHLINALDRSVNHPLFNKHSHIPLPNLCLNHF